VDEDVLGFVDVVVPTTLRSACMVLIALRAFRLSEAMSESTIRGGRESISERCDAPSGAINTIPAAKPRSVVTGRATRH
jgi:hypothetical protein